MTTDRKAANERRRTQQREAIISRLRSFIESNQKRSDLCFAVGIDAAALFGEWGISVLAIDLEQGDAELLCMLPTHAMTVKGQPHATEYCRPTEESIVEILELIGQSGHRAAIAVDIPFSWSVANGEFVSNWRADRGMKEGVFLPTRDDFQTRLTDQVFNSQYTNLEVFEIGGSLIAQAAFVWCDFRQRHRHLFGQVDVGLQRPESPITTFETYPAAFIHTTFPDHVDYKSRPENRERLFFDLFRSGYSFRHAVRPYRFIARAIWQGCVREKREQQPLAKRPSLTQSPDAFDSLLCSLSAWDYLKWRWAGIGAMTTPTTFGVDVEKWKDRILREGWILVRSASK